jgi:hypothetical protein
MTQPKKDNGYQLVSKSEYIHLSPESGRENNMKNLIAWQRIAHILLTTVLLSPLAGCTIPANRVVDPDGKPLEGVAVLEVWRASVWNPVQSSSRCTGSTLSFTDADGRFPERSNPKWWRGGEKTRRAFFKPGYRIKLVESASADRRASGIMELPKIDGAWVMERNEEYDRIIFPDNRGSNICDGTPTVHEGYCKYLDALAGEFKRLAKNEDQHRDAAGKKIRALECEAGRKFSSREQDALWARYRGDKAW